MSSVLKIDESCVSANSCGRISTFLASHSGPVVILGVNDAFMVTNTRASFLSHIEEEEPENDENRHFFFQILKAIESHPFPVVCAIDGHVNGGSGLEFIMTCDYRVSSQNVEFSVNENFLSPSQNSMDKLLSGQVITAEEAHSICLIDEVVLDDHLLLVGAKLAEISEKRPQKGSCLLHYLPDEYLKFRTSQVFNLIRDFPDSSFAIDELREAIAITNQCDYVVGVIARQLEDRLLIPGAHTEDILQMYLRTFQVVKLLFGDSREIFSTIAQSIIAHLHKRTDAVKCIVSSILEQNNDNDLLIGVYGGRDDFLTEYKEMLSTRLLSLGSFDIERELASLDLMRSKFGQPELLTDCTVMVQDISESKKIHDGLRNFFFSAFVLTRHSWPLKSSLEDNSADMFSFLPESVTTAMRTYEESFSKLKPTQKLVWIKQEGVVNITVDGAKNFAVSPVHLQVLFLFNENPTTAFSIETVSSAIGEPIESAKSVVQFWVEKNLVREIEINQYVLIC